MANWSLHIVALEIFFRQLLFLTSATYTLPVLLVCAISFYGRGSHLIEFGDIKKLGSLCMFCSAFGVFTAFANPIILYANLCSQRLNPRIPSMFEGGMLPYTTSFMCYSVGIVSLILFNIKLASLTRHRKISFSSYLALILASAFFFVSIILKQWPFSGYPDGISLGYLSSLVLQQALHRFVESFVPAGICGIVVSWFYLRQKPTDVKLQVPQIHQPTQIVRWCYLFCIIGLAPRVFVVLGQMTRYTLQTNMMPQVISSVMEICCVMGSLLCFVALLFPRFTKRRAWLGLAISAYMIVWNWSIILEAYQHLVTR